MSTSQESKVDRSRRAQFAFTNEQEQFRAAIRRFLSDKSPTTEVRRLMATAEGYDPAVWRQLSEDLALPGVHIPEQYGGAGFGMVELCIVTEELGRALLCAPYFSTAVLTANAIMNSGTEAQKAALLPDIAKGARLATLPPASLRPFREHGSSSSTRTVCKHRRDSSFVWRLAFRPAADGVR